MKFSASGKWLLFGVDLGALLAGWWRILSNSLKPEWKEAFLRPTPKIIASLNQNQVIFELCTNRDKKFIECLELDTLNRQPDGLILKEISQWPLVPLKEVSFEVNIGEQALLRQQIELPWQAENNLRQAAGFQLDKLTPFSSEQVYFDVIVVNRNKSTKKIVAELLVYPKTSISTYLEELVRLVGVPLDRIAAQGIPNDVNLLGESKVRFRPNKNVWWVFCLFLCGAVALGSPLVKKRSYMIEQKRQINALKHEAAGIAQKKLALEKGLKELNFILGKKSTFPPLAEAINELSRVIPDESYVPQLKFKNGLITLKGQGTNVVSLVEKLEASPLVKTAKFSATVNRNARTGLDSFSLQIKLADRNLNQ